MSRPAHTYRGARRNTWREEGCPPWAPMRLAGDNWRQPFDDTKIKHRPHAARGWNWRKGGRSVLNKLKQIWRYGQGPAQQRIDEINKMVAEELKRKVA